MNVLVAAGLVGSFSWSSANAGSLVFDTTLGDIVVDLFDDVAPLTVAQFTGIAAAGDFDGTIIHRSVPDFVIQGGGFNVTGDPFTEGAAGFGTAPEVPPVVNEPGVSNTRGTIAVARLGGQPDSGTNQFFFNLSDDNTFLDGVDGGFTVFGAITQGLDVADAIAGLEILDFNGGFPGPFGEVPVTADDGFVTVNSVAVVEDEMIELPPVAEPTLPDPVVIPPAAPDEPAAPVEEPVAPPAAGGGPAVVPSPSALAAGLLGLSALAARRRRGR